MRIKVVYRKEQDYTRERPTDLQKVHRNLDPKLHPFERSREYVRALNAVKLNRVFAKPFVGALSGHLDGVYCLARHPTSLTLLASGSADGEVRIWQINRQKCVAAWRTHEGFVRGLAIMQHNSRDSILTCGDDATIKLWQWGSTNISPFDALVEDNISVPPSPVVTYVGQHAFTTLDVQHRTPYHFATGSGHFVSLWELQRSNPLHTFEWSVESVLALKFNLIESHILASSHADRSITLFDLRAATPIRRLILSMNSNAISWNPMEAFHFTVANEDHNCYTFDVRKLDIAHNVHTDHVSAVLDVDYSPTGREFATGSYDRTIRIFPIDQGRSREVYHTRRMQRIFTVRFSADAQYVLSGSDDTNIRLWKARASEPIRVLLPRQRDKANYEQALIERYKHLPEIRRIHRKRHLPKLVYKIHKTKQIMRASQRRKLENVIAHSKPNAVKRIPERKKPIVTVVT
jgi:WD repeat and SOF domain-containing protein 1